MGESIQALNVGVDVFIEQGVDNVTLANLREEDIGSVNE